MKNHIKLNIQELLEIQVVLLVYPMNNKENQTLGCPNLPRQLTCCSSPEGTINKNFILKKDRKVRVRD